MYSVIIIIYQHQWSVVYIENYNILLLNNPDTTTVPTVNKLTMVNTLLIIADLRTPHDRKTAKVISIK